MQTPWPGLNSSIITSETFRCRTCYESCKNCPASHTYALGGLFIACESWMRKGAVDYLGSGLWCLGFGLWALGVQFSISDRKRVVGRWFVVAARSVARFSPTTHMTSTLAIKPGLPEPPSVARRSACVAQDLCEVALRDERYAIFCTQAPLDPPVGNLGPAPEATQT